MKAAEQAVRETAKTARMRSKNPSSDGLSETGRETVLEFQKPNNFAHKALAPFFN